MNEHFSYTTVDRIYAKLQRDTGIPFNELDVVEWIGEALEAIGAVRQYEEAVAFIQVRNHQCLLPRGFHAVVQIARNTCYVQPEEGGICAADVIQQAPQTTTTSQEPPNTPVLLDCDGMPIGDYDVAYYRPYFDAVYEYQGWIGSPLYRSCFRPVVLANHSFFNSLVCQETHEGLYDNCTDEYTIIGGTALRFSFQEGQVALAFLRQKLDSVTGYPMVPDHYSYVTALTKYVVYKKMEKDFYAGREGSSTRLQKAEDDWHWYCKQAGSYALMLKGNDEYQNSLNQRNYLLPRQNSYYNYFGNLGQPENRVYNDPDHRNIRGFNYFRGIG